MKAYILKYCAVPVALSLTGCGANFNSVFRQFDADGGQSISVDAKQRMAFSGKRAGYTTQTITSSTDAQGKPIIATSTTTVEAQAVICSEPSPDALSVLGAAFGASGSEAQKLALSIAGSTTETGSNIGLRTQTIQILRDAMYRLCEGYQANALSPLAFERLQRRYQNAMLGLLAVEQLTGAVTPQPSSISAAAPPYPDFGQKDKNSQQKPGNATDTTDQEGAAKKTPTATSPSGNSNRAYIIRTSTKKPQNAAKDIAGGASDANAGNAPNAQTAPETVPKISDTTAAAVANTVYWIVDDILKTDYSTETCLNYVVDSSSVSKDDSVLQFCRNLLNIAAKNIPTPSTPPAERPRPALLPN